MKQNNGLQLLRFIAAALVLFVHLPSYALFPLFAGEQRLFSGAIGVDVFFCISGLVMYLSVGDKSGPAFALNFAIRRLFRIVPLYFLLTTILYVLLSVRTGDFAALSSCLGKSLAFSYCAAQGGYADPIIPMGWSLNYEMFFYALLCSGMLIFKRNVVQCVALSLVALAIFGWITGNRIYYVNTIIVEFVFGILLGMFGEHLRRKIPRSAVVLLVCSVVTLFIFVMLGNDGPEIDPGAVPRMTIYFDGAVAWPRWFVWGVPSLLICATLYWLGHLIPNSAAKLGDYSYSIYLSQVLVIAVYGTVVKFALGNSGLATPELNVMHTLLILVSTFIVSYGLYHLVEMPFINLGKKFAAKPAAKAGESVVRL